jgi:hypothetical protein
MRQSLSKLITHFNGPEGIYRRGKKTESKASFAAMAIPIATQWRLTSDARARTDADPRWEFGQSHFFYPTQSRMGHPSASAGSQGAIFDREPVC